MNPTPLRRRRASALSAAALLAAFAAPLWAQVPDKPLRIILPVGAGSGVDTITRAVGPSLSKALGGQPVLIENLPGAGGITGTAALVKSAPDGQHHRHRLQQPRHQPERLQEDAL
jgi:tripartite-type tricarboxylate transporter receptor subunit TctC